MTTPQSPPPTTRTRPRIPRWLRIAVSVVVLALVAWFVLIPQFGQVMTALQSLRGLSVPLVLTAAVLELTSLLSYSALTSAVLGRRRLPFLTVLRIDLSDLAVNHTLPGGGTTAAAVRYRLLVSSGISGRRALTAATVEITGSNLVLGVLFGIGVAASIGRVAGSSDDVVAAIAVAVLLLVAVATVWTLLSRTDSLARAAARLGRRVTFIGEVRARDFVTSTAANLREFGADRPRMAAALTFAAGNWMLDAAALAVMLAAIGHQIGLAELLTVYGVGSILAMLPLTPGGIGIVEGVMVPALVALSVPHASALLGVVGWRLLEFWLPIPLGAIAYLSLRTSRRRMAAIRGRKNQRLAKSITTT